jgi:hypothetical protein
VGRTHLTAEIVAVRPRLSLIATSIICWERASYGACVLCLGRIFGLYTDKLICIAYGANDRDRWVGGIVWVSFYTMIFVSPSLVAIAPL